MGVIAVMYQQSDFLQESRHRCVIKFHFDCVLGFDESKGQHLRYSCRIRRHPVQRVADQLLY
jgi:hypothetical protein